MRAPNILNCVLLKIPRLLPLLPSCLSFSLFPPFVVDVADVVCRRLLQPDRSKRFGNLKAGAADIREHKWFKGFDWQAMVTRSMAAPIVPEVRSPGDTRNFDKYPDDDEVSPPPLDPRSKELFRDF